LTSRLIERMFDQWVGPVWGSTGPDSHKTPASDSSSKAGTRMATATATMVRGARTVSPPGTARLMMAAQRALADAHAAVDPAERYAQAHLAALRAAAGLLADRRGPIGTRPRRPTSAWTLLVGVAPELEPWAAHFAAGAGKRAAAEAGVRGAVSPAEADDLLRDAAAFVGVVETTLGVLSLSMAGAGINRG
jgi:hypothetical protein